MKIKKTLKVQLKNIKIDDLEFSLENSRVSSNKQTRILWNAPRTYLVVSSILFTFGIFAVITRKNAVAILMGIELILNSANINFIAFDRFNGIGNLDGHVFSIFVIVLAAAEAAVALAIVINLFKNIDSVDVDNADLLKG